MTKQSFKIQELCMIGVVTTIICIMAQISIPTPFGLPFTMQTFAIALAAIILGARKGTISTFIYILLGGIGLPVFSHFTGGYQCLVGPNGGFILSFPLLALIAGIGMKYYTKWKWSLLLGLILGTTCTLLCGTLMFSYITKSSFFVAFMTCGLPFLPGELIKICLVSILGPSIKKRIR